MKTLEFIVQQIPEGRLDRHEVLVSPEEIDLEIEDVRFVGLIYGYFQLSRHVDEVYVKGHVSTSAEVLCRRCVEPFEVTVKAEIEVQFYPTNDEDDPLDTLLSDTGERYYSGSTIDLSEEVRQVITLETPLWPLCSESCRGLCPVCGENLNHADCGCHVSDKRSSPFAALADLLNPSEETLRKGS